MTAKPTEKLKTWLDEQVRTLKPGMRIPSDEELAATWGLSVRTVKKVMKDYGDKGLLWRIQGRGTFMPGPQPQAPSAHQAPESSVEAVVRAVCASISRGEFKIGRPLPSLKFMSESFKVSPRTVIDAYRRLRDMGLVEKIGKTFWVGGLSSIAQRRPRKEVYLFYDDRHEITRIFKHDFLSPAYRRMEEELTAYGYVLRFEKLETLGQLIRGWKRAGRWPHGLVFFDVIGESFEGSFELLSTQFAKPGMTFFPVLVDFYRGRINTRHKWLRVISRGSIITAFSRSLVRLIFEGNYRGVCFFFDDRLRFWDEYDPWIPTVRIYNELTNINPRLPFHFFVHDSTGTATIERFIPRAQNVDEELSKYGTKSREQLQGKISIVKSFDQACQRLPDTDLWVFSSDEQAMRAIHRLGDRGKRVPRDISIIGLQNDPAFYHEGITYCGPDWNSIGYLMAHALIGDIPIDRTTKGFIRTTAVVAERFTTKE